MEKTEEVFNKADEEFTWPDDIELPPVLQEIYEKLKKKEARLN